ncbi:hypothetical protein LP420_38180 [Massilia sp. B-10]|nr:hypothetical protein LP420_38180 [Massilia sp. B-10]
MGMMESSVAAVEDILAYLARYMVGRDLAKLLRTGDRRRTDRRRPAAPPVAARPVHPGQQRQCAADRVRRPGDLPAPVGRRLRADDRESARPAERLHAQAGA